MVANVTQLDDIIRRVEELERAKKRPSQKARIRKQARIRDKWLREQAKVELSEEERAEWEAGL